MHLTQQQHAYTAPGQQQPAPHTPQHQCPPSRHRIRDLNDEINKLIREKGHWERRIVDLGGPDYAKTAPKVTDTQGNEISETSGRGGGYRYFGAAKNLPGVKELFEKEAPKQVGAQARCEGSEISWCCRACHCLVHGAPVGPYAMHRW
jgi:hypothetical protein